MRSSTFARRWLLSWVAGAALTPAIAAAPVRAETAGTLRIAVEGDYPPFNQVDKKGRLSGFDVDIANAVCDAMNASCTFVRQSWERMIPDLVDGKYDLVVSSLSITAARRQRIDFSDPYYLTPAKFVGRKDAGVPSSLEALKGRRIGVQKATTHESYLARKLGSGVEIVRYETLPKAQADLAAGKVDLVFADAVALLQGFLKTDQGKAFTFIGPDLRVGNGIGIGVRKGQSDLVASLNRALERIRVDGTYDKIATKYFEFPLPTWDTAAIK